METKEATYKLKFFGTGSGSGVEHNNAFFLPDPKTLVFVDLSAVHLEKARGLLEALRHQIEEVYLCVTHCHPDHISGVTNLVYLVRHYFPGTRLKVFTEATVGRSLEKILVQTGAGKSFPDDPDGLYTFANGYAESRPHWLREIVRTEHAPKLPGGAVGFVFQIDGVFVVYSGDTNVLEPFSETEAISRYGCIEKQFYLDIAMSDRKGLHLVYDERLEDNLMWLLERQPKLEIIFMHCADKTQLAKRIEQSERLSERLKRRIHIAEVS